MAAKRSSRAATKTGFGFRTPFPVFVPSPDRLNAGAMRPELICFDGDSVGVKYSECRWGKTVEDRFVYHREITSVEAILGWMAKRWRLNKDQRVRLRSLCKAKRCGHGSRVHLTPELLRRLRGYGIAGGSMPLFLLSPGGRRGALEVATSIYHKYRPAGFKIGKAGAWKFLTEPGAEWSAVELIASPSLTE